MGGEFGLAGGKGMSVGMSQEIQLRSPDQLVPYPKNARRHPKKQIAQIANSIEKFGFNNPVLIDANNMIVCGHGRVEAAKHLGWETIPCLVLDHLSDDEKRAYILADNKIAENAAWDTEILCDELSALLELDTSFDIGVTGFDAPEVDSLLDGLNPEAGDDPEADDIPNGVVSRVQRGDLWQLGRHRLICGDSLSPAIVNELMDGEKARMVFTDPPYNVPIDGHVSGLGKHKHNDFAMASGEMSKGAFSRFLEKAFSNLVSASMDGSIHFICMDWRHMPEILTAGERVYSELKNLIVWAKDNGGMGTFYRSRHELIFAFKAGSAPHQNNFLLGQHGRYRTNVWQYRGMSSRSQDRDQELALHPTIKPAKMIADAIRDVSGRGDIILDLFGGSGSTLIASEMTGRRCYMSELDPSYCDIILARWEHMSKDEAVRLPNGPTKENAA